MNRTEKLIREVPFEQTEAAFYATQEYFNEFHQAPPEDLDLRAWIPEANCLSTEQAGQLG